LDLKKDTLLFGHKVLSIWGVFVLCIMPSYRTLLTLF